jgi:hypothetical protein
MSRALTPRAQLASAVAEAVIRVPGVERLSPGPGQEAAVQYAGGKVLGVQIIDQHIAVHVLLNRLPLTPVVARVRGRIDDVLARRNEGGAAWTIDVVVEGVELDHLPRRPGGRPVRNAPVQRFEVAAP